MTTQGFSKEYRLTVDASDVGVGAVLLQERKDDIHLRTAIFLKRLSKFNNSYPQLKNNYLPYCYLSSILMYILSIRGVH